MIQFSACKIWQVSYKVFEEHWVKQPQRLCITKCGRPTLPSSTRLARPPARPHHPCNPWICNWRDAAADVRVNFKVVGVDFEVFYRDQSSYPKLSRSCAGHLRTVQRHLRTVPNGSEALSVGLRVVFTSGLRAGSGLLGPLRVFCRGTGFRSPKFGWWVTDWCNQVTTSNFLTNSPDQKFVLICKKKLCYCEETLCNSPFVILNFRCVTFDLLYFLFSFTKLNFYYLIAKQTILNVHLTWVILHAWRI